MNIDNLSYELSKSELKALLQFRARDAMRPALHGILFSGRTAVATDGHRLAILTADGDADGPEPFLVDSDVLERASKLSDKRGVVVVTRVEGVNRATVQVFDKIRRELGAFVSQVEDVKFPPYEQCIVPRPDCAVSPIARAFGVNAFYLADFAVVQDAAGCTGVTMFPPVDETSPIRIEIGRTWVIIQMPVRIDFVATQAAA